MRAAGRRLMLALTVGAAAMLAPVSAEASQGATVEISYSSAGALTTALSASGAEVVRNLPQIHVAEVRAANGAAALARELRRAHGIKVRLPVRRDAAADALTLGLVSTPAGGAYEWQYYATAADRVPPGVRAAARKVTIAVIDTGADISAAGLGVNVAASYDARTGRRPAGDQAGHGTFVTSLLSGSVGVSGFAGSARVLVVKVADSDAFSDVDVAAGILYAIRHGARIINLSLAGRASSPAEAAAVRYATAKGALLVAAAGNDALAGNPVEYPAALIQPLGSDGVGGSGIVVGASDFAGGRAPFSEFGSFLSLVAPGTSVFGALPATSRVGFQRVALPSSPGTYAFASGTSFAVPQVAGAAALVWAAAPNLAASSVADILKHSASGGGIWRAEIGFGVLDVARAVELALSSR